MKYFNNELFPIRGVLFRVKLFPTDQLIDACKDCILKRSTIPCRQFSNFNCYQAIYGKYEYVASLNEIYNVTPHWIRDLLPRT